VVELAGTLRAPIVHALRGKEYMEYDNPHDVGMTGLLGFASGYKAIKEADVLLMLGTDFPYRQFYPDNATIIQVDIDGSHLGRRAPVDLGLLGTVKDTISALQPLLFPASDGDHLDRALKHYRKTRKRLTTWRSTIAIARRSGRNTLRGFPVNWRAMMRCSPMTSAPTIWAARYLTMNGRRRLIGSATHGSMAGALSHAIRAQTVDRGRQVVALAGDGGLTMLFGELVTLKQNRLPVKVIVFKNSSLGFVELEMKAAGIVNFGTDLAAVDFAAVARAVGLFAHRVEQPADLNAALQDAFAHDGPAVIDVVTARQELTIPPTITAEQVKGFSLYAIRTILAGRGDELLDLVSTNVARRILD
jgi:pyruvate dehydrogenase (quinone)